MPKVSIIIPVYNRCEKVKLAIDSVLAQTFQDFEVIVVDDGSDPAQQIPDRVSSDPRVRVARHAANKGASAARNTGVTLATGAYLCFLDSDDTWCPSKLDCQLKAAEQADRVDKGPVAIVTGFMLQKARSGESKILIPRIFDDPLAYYRGVWFSPGSTLMVAAKDFRAVGMFDESLERLEDLDWFIRFSVLGGRMIVVKSVLATIVVTAKPPADTITRACALLLEKLGRQNALSPAAERALRAYLHLELAAVAYYGRKFGWSFYHVFRSWLLVPRTSLRLASFWEPAPTSARM
jgi:hypothetical protein